MKKNNSKTGSGVGKIRKIAGPVTLFVISILLTVFMQFTENDDQFADSYYPIKDGWNVTVNGKEFKNKSLDQFSFPTSGAGDTFEMKNKLPYRYSSASLAVYSVHSCFTVLLDNEELYSYGYDDMDKKRLTGYGFHKIILPQNYEGKELVIKMTVLEEDSFTTIDCPRLCNQEIYDYSFIYNSRMSLAINVFLIVFGIISAVISLALAFMNKKIFRMLYVSLFSVSIGCWSLANYNLFHVFNSSLKVKTYFEFASLYLAPLFIMLYFKETACSGANIRKKIYYILLSGYLIYAACAFGGQITNLVHFPDFLSVCHLLMITIILFIIICTALDLKKKKEPKSMMLWGLIILFIFASSDVFRYYYTKYLSPSWLYNYQNRICIGFLIFVISIFSDYIRSIIRSMYKAAESETLEKIAYTDALTGLFNRRKCENIFDEIDNTGSEYTVIVFDLNHLKQVNDSKGHEEGDRYINSFGEILKDVFGRSGEAARTGGDEFVVISKTSDKDDTERLIEEMNHKIKIRNIQNPGWNMSTAFGYCTSDENIFENIRKAYKEADSRMYENKIKTKEALKVSQT